MRRRPSIGAVLLALNLAALVLPVGGLWILRVYESALIRQTESELIAQAGMIAAVYGQSWRTAGGKAEHLGPPLDERWTRRPGYDSPWLPRFASLDLAEDKVLPAPPDAVAAPRPATAAARAAGALVEPVLRDAQRVTLAAMRVVDHRGVVVATTGEDGGQSLGEMEEISRALAGEPVSTLRHRVSRHAPPTAPGLLERSRAMRVFVAQPVLEGDRVAGVVLLSRTPRTLADALYGKRWHLAFLAVLTLVTAAALTRLGTVAITRPLKTVMERARRAAGGERGAMAPLDGTVVREVAELGQSLSRMADTLERRADYIRDFAAHVSHEFKTPLTTIHGTVELLRDHFDVMAPEERARFLANLDAEAGRLSRLVGRLLELARADVMASGEPGRCDAVPVVAAQAARVGAQTRLPDMAPVAMTAEALDCVLANLLDNARRHAGPGGRITVTLDTTPDRAVLRVADDGPGVSAANAERIFTPFFTTARSSGGTGLGLAIVRSVLAGHGGSVTLTAGAGATFEVVVPRPPETGTDGGPQTR